MFFSMTNWVMEIKTLKIEICCCFFVVVVVFCSCLYIIKSINDLKVGYRMESYGIGIEVIIDKYTVFSMM
jgi:hypothetical protein